MVYQGDRAITGPYIWADVFMVMSEAPQHEG